MELQFQNYRNDADAKIIYKIERADQISGVSEFYIPAVGLNYPTVKSGSIQVDQCDTQQWMPLSSFPERRMGGC